MKCILLKWILCLLLGFSSVSYSQEFTIDFSTQQSYVSSLNSIRTAISTPLEHISQGATSVSVINHTPPGSYISVGIRGLDVYQERFDHLRLIIERNNLYVAGFVNTTTNTFYRFSDFAHISLPGVTTISMTTDSSYTTLQRVAALERSGMQISRHSLVSSYLALMEFSGNTMTREASRAVLRFVTVTAEALRFRQIQREFRQALSETAPVYTMTPEDVDLTLNWGRISNVLPEYRGEDGVRVGRISFNNISAILGTVAVILNCHHQGARFVRAVNEESQPECQITGDRPVIKINNKLWESNTAAAFLNRKSQPLYTTGE
ncbi:Shiga toxin Stx2 subunit A [Escherichia coli]|uniref:Shiga toxin Stx2 subunit A, e/i/l/k subtype n=1 Tax=Escherichia coli TaxID=562 RepID=UPI001BFC8D51|nr:Shiga toxin Stx2 subunit A, e/i/l/k subtype [Escherichia coli]EEY6644195.1 Shiga toxin Stx2 subunit A [Escherichia coli]EHX9360657.1 Shiga toxin Stx2 subunit A [Escherichia coli]EHX9362789.1 Shiga toxin Stx2 subunit A [Escherichia coli]EKQ3862370.1 Shiga toxin Stx2 subunit A [Escherichia coli]EKQ3863193.1 Shiga toxin Stx2 subunit A [Escherichia coli]